MGFSDWSLFCCVVFVESFVVLRSSRWGGGDWLLCFQIVFLVTFGSWCSVSFLAVLWVGLLCVIMVIPSHNHLLFL